MSRFGNKDLPFAVITITVPTLSEPQVKAIIDGMGFPTGQVSPELERLSVNTAVHQQSVVTTIHYRCPFHRKGPEQAFWLSMLIGQSFDRDTESIFEGIKAALSVFEPQPIS